MTTQTELIDTTSRLESFLDGIIDDTSKPLILYVDLEGNNLSRHGTLSLVTIFVESESKVYFVDVTTLQHDAFDTAGSNGRTLRAVLESDDIIKVFFDIRTDSDALFSLYGVCVSGIEDLQLMELASRTFDKRHLNGLAKCIERDSTIGFKEKQEWKSVKEKGKKLFEPRYGGSYAVFDERPLSPEIHTYCVQDVTLMPHLRAIYRAKLCDAWWKKIDKETKARVKLSQSANFNSKGQHMAQGPRGWLYWNPTHKERLLRTLFEPTAAPSSPAKEPERPASPLRQQIDSEVPYSKPKTIDEVLQQLQGLNLTSTSSTHAPQLVQNEEDKADEEWNEGDDEWDREDEGYDLEDEALDHTACDSECGYCGRCMY